MNLTELFRRRPVFWTISAVAFVLVVATVVILAVSFYPVQVDSIRMDKEELFFSSFTQTYRLTVETEPAGIKANRLLWTSSDESVATVSSKGVVTPVGEGVALITASARRGNGLAHCTVTVSAITQLSLNQHDVTLFLNESSQLLYTVEPQGVDSSQLIWSSSDASTVFVDPTGAITALRPGSAQITLTTIDGTMSDTCNVLVVEDIPVEGVCFDITEFLFDEENDVLVLTPVFTPASTSQRELEWMSTDESVALINGETGEVTAVSNGTASIIAKSPYGDFSATCQVTVARNVPLKGVSLSTDTYTFTGLGQTYLIVPVFSPFNASNQNITWTSSDPSVATVSAQGLVTCLKKGTATIKLVTQDGGYTAEFKVTVSPSDRINVTGVKLSSYSAELSKGGTCQISASVLPSNATEKGLKYSSKNTSVATVSASGAVTAVNYGTTQIVVSSVDGGYSENFTVTIPEPVVESPTVTMQEYVRGVWIATVANINFPSKSGLSSDELRAEIDNIMNNVVQMGLNTVYFQVRPCGDALYPSQYYPSSAYVVGAQGDKLPLDILGYAVEAAHARGLSLHAWINPYRVTQNTTLTSKLASSNPAVKNPGWVISDGKKLYLNPGLPEVRNYIIDGVMEIVRNYNVDGIHFDDYFYPNDLSKWDDSEAYGKYGNGLSLEDWRRANNDALIKGVHDAVESYNSAISFGVSPAGVWGKKSNALPDGTDNIGNTNQTYYQGFADTKKWVENEWLDYICPQVYWEIDHGVAPFKPIVSWWNDLVKDTDVRLYIGIAAYKCGGDEGVAAYESGSEIPAQLDYLDTCKNVDGAVFYSYGSLMDYGVKDVLHARYYKEPVSLSLHFMQPSMTVSSSFKSTYVVGVSDPNYPLYADGKLVERTSDGYFAYEVSLVTNRTVVRFFHKGKTVEYVITRTVESSGSSKYLSSFGFAQGSFTPSYDTANRSGTKITFSCIAPAGSIVTATVGPYKVELSTTTKDPGDKYLKATYTGSLILPQLDGDGNASLGYVVFHAERKGEKATHSPGCLVEVINDSSSYVMIVSGDKSDVRPGLDSSIKPTSYYIATQGAKVNVVSKADGWVKLTNGMYLSVDAVKPLKSSLGLAEVRSSGMNVLDKYTVFSFKMTEAAFHTVWMNPDHAEIILYNISGEVPSLTLGNNPLFSSVKMDRIDETTVSIKLTYKAQKHIYGYTCNFDGNTLYVNFRNPARLSSSDKPLTGIVISIDPGHCGSIDPGAIRYYSGKAVYESTLTMKLSKLVAEKLTDLGATVILSHSENESSYLLDDVIKLFRSRSPDINVSIHFNAVENNSQSVTGTEAYWCYGNSQLLSEVLLKSFTESTGFRARKSVCDYYKVSRLCEFPSILFETAFISNASDLAYFMDDAKMDRAAAAIANGILDYFKEQNN